MKRLLSIAALSAALALPAASQCVMCFRSAQSQQAARAHVLNLGILSLGIPPFLILAGFVVFVFKRDHIEHEEVAATSAWEADRSECLPTTSSRDQA